MKQLETKQVIRIKPETMDALHNIIDIIDDLHDDLLDIFQKDTCSYDISVMLDEVGIISDGLAGFMEAYTNYIEEN